MQSFNLSTCNQLSVSDAKSYITKYFFPLSSGQHVYVSYDDDERRDAPASLLMQKSGGSSLISDAGKPQYEIKEDNIVKSVYFNRLPKVIQTYYFKEYDQIRTLTCELNKPFIYGNYINTCPSLMHTIKEYSTYSKETQLKVEMMLSFVKEIWASGNENQFKFIIKWFSNMSRGGKNQSVLYLRGEQGIGKSTFTDFLRKFVIGPKLCIQSGSQPLISQFNSILFCKLLVIFEELENFSTGQWQGVSTRLKRDTTSDTCMYEEKNQKAFTAKNISNYIINSNVDAIKDDDGRRYFILDLSNKRKGDQNYFDSIYKNCMNEEVGEAFFSYLQTIDLNDYHDQDFPPTKAKDDAIVKRLDSVVKYLKDKYILRNKSFDTNLKDAHLEYIAYCVLNNLKDCCKIEFNKKLETLHINSFKSGNEHKKYKVKIEKLMEIAEKNKWIHSTDVFENEDKFVEEPSNLDIIDDEKEEMRKEIKRLREQIELLNKPKITIDMEQIINNYNETSTIINKVQKEIKMDKQKRNKQFETSLDELEAMC